MSAILTVATGLASVVFPAVELSRRLAAAGHRVALAGSADARPLAERCDLEFAELAASRYDAFLEADAADSITGRLARIAPRREAAVDSLGIDEFLALLGERRPDLVLVNGEMHEHIIAASAAGWRVALLNTFVSIWRRSGLPPPHHLAIPGKGWRGTAAGMALLWANLRVKKSRRRFADMVRTAGADRVAVLEALGRRHGFDVRRETDDGQWLIPFTYRRIPVLSLHAREFEFPHEPPAHVRYVGPMILETLARGAVEAPDRERLGALIDRRRRAPERRLIYAGFGSALSADSSLIRRVIDSIAGRPAWDLVISLSRRLSASSLGPVPERVHVFDWVPQPDLLRHADAAITHGGINTIDECVSRGVPPLVYWGRHTDMGGTTSRVVYHGIGIAGDARRDGPDAIRSHLDRLLGDATFGERVERLRLRYAAYADERVAEREVDSLLGVSTEPNLKSRVDPVVRSDGDGGAGAERGLWGPASEGEGGAGGAKPPGLE